MRLTERYRLAERLDHGGTMEVWRAQDELLGRPVAVKLPTPARADLHRAFQQGVSRAAGLSHAALETVYDSDLTRDAAGRLVSFAVTEFLEGETLGTRLRLGPPAASDAAGVAAQVAAALQAAHAAGVPHGDLHTGKIFLFGGDVKVADTGIAGIVRGVRGAPGRGGAPVAAGAALEEAKAADVRAFGAVLSACLGPDAPAALTSLAARCASATPGEGPSASEIAALLGRDDEPRNAVFTTIRSWAAPSRDDARTRTRTLRPPARSRGGRGRARLAGLALVIAVPATAAAAMLVSAPRAPVTVAPPPGTRTHAERPPSPPPRRHARPPAAAGVTDALGRLRPIVSRGYSSGQIRSDVALDLTNVITNLENDLTADRAVDLEQRIDLLQDKIATRERERGLSPALAAELNRVLASIQT
ncbi:MAG: hypothetical protein FWJ90_16630 [Actinomadura sp.]